MNGHVTPWLATYHDGELKGRRLRQVEAHLAECATCRAELNELQCLSALLHESPVAEDLLPPERFVAQVGLRLERRPTKVAAVALANKMARMAWALMTRGERFRPEALMAA